MAIKGDFISFTYNGVHSTDLGVMRVTSSNRYTDALLPTIQDKTVLVPGSNGTYFFGSYYTLRPITINAVFDDVSESLIRLMRKVFGDLLSHELIFDDEPYKIYYAKATGTPQLQYIPFSSPRVYKGEGTFTFTCYEPFAHCPNLYKYLDTWVVNGEYYLVSVTAALYTGHLTDYYILSEDLYIQCTSEDLYDSTKTYYKFGSNGPSWYKYNNKDEWNLSAGLLTTKGTYDTYDTGSFKVYNPGDLEAEFKFTISITANIAGIKVTDGSNDLASHILLLNGSAITAKGTDTSLVFNSKTNLIEGLNALGARTMNLYNEYIQSGHWFKIPKNEVNKTWYFTPIYSGTYSGAAPTLEYDYLYF